MPSGDFPTWGCVGALDRPPHGPAPEHPEVDEPFEAFGGAVHQSRGIFNEKWASILRGPGSNWVSGASEGSKSRTLSYRVFGSLRAEPAGMAACESARSLFLPVLLVHGCTKSSKVLREISLILRVNERMVIAIGTACHAQLAGPLRPTPAETSARDLNLDRYVLRYVEDLQGPLFCLRMRIIAQLLRGGLQRLHLPQYGAAGCTSHAPGKCPEPWGPRDITSLHHAASPARTEVKLLRNVKRSAAAKVMSF